MSLKEPKFTIGIEEEYHLVDLTSRDLVPEPPATLLSACQAALAGQVSPEFLQSQIEVGTRVCSSLQDARAELAHLRTTVADVARSHGLAPIAASTHPFARWSRLQHTDKARYHDLARDLQGVARRMVVSGMHVHVGIENDDLRIDLMNQARYFLPHLLALSTSSPFWEGENTGLKSFRLAIFGEVPRTGLPGRFSGWSEYTRTIDVLVKAGVIEDATKIWWDLRPSARFPTLEMRITDVCPRLDDGIAIAALFICICRMLYRLRRTNLSWRLYPVFLLEENRWRAQRYGLSDRMFDFGKGELVPAGALIEELLMLVAEDADALGCTREVAHVRTIVARGTSADRQVACHDAAVAAGMNPQQALEAVVDQLVSETRDVASPGPGGP